MSPALYHPSPLIFVPDEKYLKYFLTCTTAGKHDEYKLFISVRYNCCNRGVTPGKGGGGCQLRFLSPKFFNFRDSWVYLQIVDTILHFFLLLLGYFLFVSLDCKFGSTMHLPIQHGMRVIYSDAPELIMFTI